MKQLNLFGEGQCLANNEVPVIDTVEDPVLDKLMSWHDGRGFIQPANEEIVSLLGENVLESFIYTYTILKGIPRKDCDNTAVAHSYDVAARIRRFIQKYGQNKIKHIDKYTISGLMHDNIEESCRTLGDVERRFIEIATKFSNDRADEVLSLTNLYSLFVDMVKTRVERVSQLENFLGAAGVAFGKLHPSLREKYRYLLEDITAASENITDERIEELRRENNTFNVINLLKFDLYQNYYLVSIARKAVSDFSDKDPLYDLPIIVKIFDSVDGVRTMPITKMRDAGKVIKKAEMKVDLFSDVFNNLPNEHPNRIFLKLAVDYLRDQIIDQARRRIKALDSLNDTRYNPVKIFFESTLSRLEEKYKNGQ